MSEGSTGTLCKTKCLYSTQRMELASFSDMLYKHFSKAPRASFPVLLRYLDEVQFKPKNRYRISTYCVCLPTHSQRLLPW